VKILSADLVSIHTTNGSMATTKGYYMAARYLQMATAGGEAWLRALIANWRWGTLHLQDKYIKQRRFHSIARAIGALLSREISYHRHRGFLDVWRENARESVSEKEIRMLRVKLWRGQNHVKRQEKSRRRLEEEVLTTGLQLGEVAKEKLSMISSLQDQLRKSELRASQCEARTADVEAVIQFIQSNGDGIVVSTWSPLEESEQGQSKIEEESVGGRDGNEGEVDSNVESDGASDSREPIAFSLDTKVITRTLHTSKLIRGLSDARLTLEAVFLSARFAIEAWFAKTKEGEMRKDTSSLDVVMKASDARLRLLLLLRIGVMLRDRRHLHYRSTLSRWARRAREACVLGTFADLGLSASRREASQQAWLWEKRQEESQVQAVVPSQETEPSTAIKRDGELSAAAVLEAHQNIEREEKELAQLRRELTGLAHDRDGLESSKNIYKEEVEKAKKQTDALLREALDLEGELSVLHSRRDKASQELKELEDGSAMESIQKMIEARLPALKAVEWEWEEVSSRHEDLIKKVQIVGTDADGLKTTYRAVMEENKSMEEKVSNLRQEMGKMKCEKEVLCVEMEEANPNPNPNWKEVLSVEMEEAKSRLSSERAVRNQILNLINSSSQKLAEANEEMDRVDAGLKDRQATLRLKLESLAELQSDIVAMLPPGLDLDEGLFQQETWKEELEAAVDTQMHNLLIVRNQLQENIRRILNLKS